MGNKLEYVYYWFDHLYVRFGAEELGIKFNIDDVENAILNHDWNKFRLYRFLLDEIEHTTLDGDVLEFFPDTISVSDEEGNIDFIPLTKENFKLINDVGHECG